MVMAKLFGKTIGRKELEKRLGNMRQVAGVRLATLDDGMERGVQVAEVTTGSGFGFTVGLSRGMDIFDATYCGRSLGWLSPVGLPAPTYYDPTGLGWLKTFGGGLVTTCGLLWAGAPCVDEGKALGLHGRVSHLPAQRVSVREEWVGEEYQIALEGEVIEAVPVHGQHVRLKRKISTKMGESRFTISDTVENFGYITVPHMILYHTNVGYPFVDEGAKLLAPSIECRPRDEAAEVEAEKWMEILPPIENFAERCYRHWPGADADGKSVAAIVNPEIDNGLALYVNFDRKQLPVLTEWKMCAAGNYVIGIEPANCFVTGRDQAREHNELQFLEPGESRQYDVEIGILAGAEALAGLEARVQGMR
jgi:hypothetical protein